MTSTRCFSTLAEDMLPVAQIIVYHGEDSLVTCHVADNAEYIPIPSQFAGLLAAVTYHDLVAALIRADKGDWFTPPVFTLSTRARIAASSHAS